MMTDISPYQRICDALTIAPVDKLEPIESFLEPGHLLKTSKNARLTAALDVVLQCIQEDDDYGLMINRQLIDKYITKIDVMVNAELNAILHHPDFQQLESSWRGVASVIKTVGVANNVKLDLLDVTKAELAEDFDEALEPQQSALYQHVYIQEYDTPGGEPYAAMIGDYHFTSSQADITLLRQCSSVASAAHAPFISAAGAAFFHQQHMADVMAIDDIHSYLDCADYITWQQFRHEDSARYVGLVLPDVLLRLPYHEKNPAKACPYFELCQGHADFLWGNAAYAFAANMAQSFIDSGWAVNIRGPESGGKVNHLPLHQYDAGRGVQTKIPTETLIPETRELALANLGFMPLSYYKNSDFACFFSANSMQQPKLYTDTAVTANSRINSRLPYVFLSSRIAHYLKVLQRENIGAAKSAQVLEAELNAWLQTLVTTMANPNPELIAKHPLRQAYVKVIENLDNPGYYKVDLFVCPHFQVEGIDVMLSLVSQMPIGNENEKGR